MIEPVTIPISIFDITMEFAKPSLRLAMERAAVVEELFDKFRRWGIGVDDIEVIKDGKPSEQGVRFKIPQRRTAFFFGPANARLTWDDANWESAPETMEILSLGLGTLTQNAGIEVIKFKTSISLHIQPKNARFIDLLKPFANPALLELDARPLTAFATVLKWSDRRITIDGSAQLANGMFVRLEREFEGNMALPGIADALLQDEHAILSTIGVEEERA